MRSHLRPATPEDWDDIVALNNAEIPNVGPLRTTQRDWFLANSQTVLATDDTGTAGLLVLMFDGCGYASPNFGWHAARTPVLAYVDRVVVETSRAGTGIGRTFYDWAVHAARAAGKPVLTAEVNIDPPNARSLEFHRRFGFTEVGRQLDPRSGITVAMVALDVAQS